jgi:hypothetical protein
MRNTRYPKQLNHDDDTVGMAWLISEELITSTPVRVDEVLGLCDMRILESKWFSSDTGNIGTRTFRGLFIRPS